MRQQETDQRAQDYDAWLAEMGKKIIATLRAEGLSYRDAVRVLEAAQLVVEAEAMRQTMEAGHE